MNPTSNNALQGDLPVSEPPTTNPAAPPDNLEIGFGVLDRLGEGASREAAANDLVKQALAHVNTDCLPVRCILLLATADWCNESSATLPREIRRGFKEALGYDVPLIGGSMAGLFYLDKENHYIEHGVILVALCSHDFWATVSSLETPHGGDETERRKRVGKLAEELQAKAGMRLGASAARHLLAFSPGLLRNPNGERVYLDNELHEEILAAFNYRYSLVGGAAADGIKPNVGYQFADDRCLKSGLALAMIETDLASGTMMGHGFVADRGVHVSVDQLKDDAESGYEVAVLDGKPAKERLAELQQLISQEMPLVLLGAPSGRDYHVVRAIHQGRGPKACVWLTRRVRRGDRLFLLKGELQHISRIGPAIIQGAVRASGTTHAALKVLFGLSCVGRIGLLERLGHNWRQNATFLKKEFRGVPMIGGLCAGEFGVDQWRRALSNNFSFWANCLGSSRAPRAATRAMQDQLLVAANRLADCQTPKDVMEAALKGASEVGAIGGQVCIVDHFIGRILSLHHGCAYCPPGSAHDWAQVAARTDRPAPKEPGGQFPRYLLNWSLPVDVKRALEIVTKIQPGKEEDILTLIVRTGRAVFVADSGNPIFHCEPEAAKEGHVVTFLAIPLLGSHGKAIATLQLGFKDLPTIDHETFGLWLGYAQKVATALERAQEAEERDILQKISRLGNAIMQGPLDELEASPYSWCSEYLQEVAKLLGADDAHIRLLQNGPSGQVYRLVAAVGPMAEHRLRTRPVTRPGEGSCNLELLKAGGKVVNTRDQICGLNKDVKAIAGTDEDKHSFEGVLSKLEATAMLPLTHEGQVLGSFVVDSSQRYFFTERWQRLARAAAELGGAILRGRTDAYDRLALERERNWVLKSLSEAKEGVSSFGLKGLLKRLCAAVRADVGSLFLWFDEPEKLILHTSCGWSKDMEGKASYTKGEGWTGALAFGDSEISIVGGDGPDSHTGKRKYYEQAVSLGHRVPGEEADPRIGVRLKVRDKVVGAATFSYFKENQDELRDPNKLRRIRNFFTAATPLITLAVEDARAEAARKQQQSLLEAKKGMMEKLIETSASDFNLKPALDAIRQGLDLDRVVFYSLKNERIVRCIPSLTKDDPAFCKLAMASLGPIENLISDRTERLITSNDPHILRDWPNDEGIHCVFAVRVADPKGEAKGVLELANRRSTSDHPFEFLDSSERNAARDLAQALGAAIAAEEEQRRRAAYEKAQQELEADLTKAQAEREMRDAFEDVAHQIKSPLGEAARRVEGALGRCRQGGIREDWEGVAALLRRAELTAKLIGLFARLAKGEQLTIRGTPITPIELVQLANQICENQRPRISSKRNIRIECDSDSFFRHAPAELSADPDLLLMALNNLVDNAVKYSYSSTAIKIFCAPLKKRERGLFIAVTNKGLPIAPQEVHLVRQRHWRGETAKTYVGEGNGLGLWIVDHIMMAHGGELHVLPTRTAGDGLTEVRLAFPLADNRIRK
jgi:signal transduction histidine kinase